MRDQLAAATDRLLRTVEDLPDAAWSEPSVCAGWSRAHVIGHLALNAEGLGGALRGLLEGDPTTMYRSQADRAADIESLAAAQPDVVRQRLVSSAQAFAAAVEQLDVLPADATFERTPGGQSIRAANVPFMRLREVEIHHADLRAGYSYDDWPAETAVLFLEDYAGRYDGPPVVLRPTDLDRSWSLGDPDDAAPVLSGSTAALAWWLSGRDPGPAVTSSTGDLPTLEGQ